ncbi:hypothetical protein LTR97_002901 [Elasticomyces elasticus]|uniref:Acid phosphatase n=1 Tax=Elasticomyces elasticus TaxID=574655 RepID=A0AAN7ZV49_9PEZI|nr:hypothetical protein LTR97_002901 [Elasticomyces elasticus]
MTTLPVRPPYSQSELTSLYPANLELQQVQILLRQTGLATYWPYCEAASHFRDVIATADGEWDSMHWKRRLETFGSDNSPLPARSQSGSRDNICEPGQLTDLGRQTTLALGQRVRHLYVDQLGFLPGRLEAQTQGSIALRATPIQRALESVQQTFTGLYPPSARSAGLPPHTITKRAMWEETLFPNEGGCPRFAELAHAFAERTAQLYNNGPEMTLLNKRIGKYMPKDSPTVKVDSHPRLSGIMDSINATRAHPNDAATRLPSEFYEAEVIGAVDRVCTEEWFVGYQESNEYRKLGIGALVGDIAQKMVERARRTPSASVSDDDGAFKLGLSGCHDTTIAATLTALGGFDVQTDKWPNFTSNIAFELFRRKDAPASASTSPSTKPSWWSTLFSSSPLASATTSTRTPLADLAPSDRSKLDDHFVRLRYNDRPLTLPYCAQPGKHMEGDASFCTLAAFKEASDSFTPRDWRKECKMNLGTAGVKAVIEPPPGVGVGRMVVQ